MAHNEGGVALIVALLIAVVLSLLALSLSMSSMSEQRISSEFENHEKALLVADAGLEEVRSALTGQDLDALLQDPTSVPSYIPDSNPRPFAYRNPISLIEARNIDFDSPPAAAGHRTDHGWLTPVGGTRVGTGLYFAKLSDNQDDNDPLNDSDDTVCLRVIGLNTSLPSEAESYGSTRKNAVAVVEALLKRDTTFKLKSPLTIPAQAVETPFGGAKFKVDGYDHSSIFQSTDDIGSHDDHTLPDHPGVNVVYDDPPKNSSDTVDDIIQKLSKNEKDNFVGTGEVPSILDQTNEVKADPDSQKILDAGFLQKFVNSVSLFADEKVPLGKDPTGGYGTAENPRVLLAEGDLKITGNATGYGLLVVKGELELKGTFAYNGMLLIVGTGSLKIGGSATVLGGVLLANIDPQTHALGTARFSDHGGGNESAGIYNSSDKIAMALTRVPMRTISWREVTPEIEP